MGAASRLPPASPPGPRPLHPVQCSWYPSPGQAYMATSVAQDAPITLPVSVSDFFSWQPAAALPSQCPDSLRLISSSHKDKRQRKAMALRTQARKPWAGPGTRSCFCLVPLGSLSQSLWEEDCLDTRWQGTGDHKAGWGWGAFKAMGDSCPSPSPSLEEFESPLRRIAVSILSISWLVCF